MNDSHDLARFVAAQESGSTYARALTELHSGRKSSHWIWFIFPQIAGLGQSAIARRYAIASLAEAQAYFAHPILGPRLIECTTVVARLVGLSAEQIFGGIDAMKLRSSMTLFARAAPDEPVFDRVLDSYFDARPDPATEHRL